MGAQQQENIMEAKTLIEKQADGYEVELMGEAALCSFVLAILEQSESLSHADLLDTVLVGLDANALHALAGFDQASSKMGSLAELGDTIGWQRCLDFLERQNAIRISRFGNRHEVLAGSALLETIQAWGHDYTELASHALKALERMNELESRLWKYRCL
jgi:hypothetical protein